MPFATLDSRSGATLSIKRILLDEGLEPAPSRGQRMQWKTFLRAHFGVITAMDSFAVEVLTFGGLVRYFVLFVIDLGTRRVEIAGIARQPHGAWMKQIARNLTDGVDGFLKGTRYLIHDRVLCQNLIRPKRPDSDGLRGQFR